MNASQLAALRDALEGQDRVLRHEIAELGADPDVDEVTFDADAGFSDRSHSTEERGRVIAMGRTLRANLREVERALAKLAAGTYGACERCGRPIDDERLEAIPWTPLCIDCKRLGD
ncbi:MAG TPA: TraR/DksA C4-type zinc finger protein [Actinomycetota bacterium]|nr:TraR/DksA C4-type zinc finger protein [Actinomycetota bacterium]